MLLFMILIILALPQVRTGPGTPPKTGENKKKLSLQHATWKTPKKNGCPARREPELRRQAAEQHNT